MSETADLIRGLRKKVSAMEPKRQKLVAELDKLDDEIEAIEQRIRWLQYSYRYGDILEMKAIWPNENRKVRYVATRNNVMGRKIKKDGTLYKDDVHMIGSAVIVGRYEGSDLPEPDEAAKFGLENR